MAEDRRPALGAALLLHLGLAAAVLIALRHSPPVRFDGAPVAVSIVATAPAATPASPAPPKPAATPCAPTRAARGRTRNA